VGGTEAILLAAQQAVGMRAVPLEREHHVDQVLEDLGACEASVLGHVTDQEHRGAALPRELGQTRGDLAQLRDAARRRLQLGRADCLDRVDDHDRKG
jgi:hypothetical protein